MASPAVSDSTVVHWANTSSGTSLSEELDESFYKVDDEETAFLMQQTGINDPEELKKHILQVQREVYAVSIGPSLTRATPSRVKIGRRTV